MAKRNTAKCRLCRREGAKLFLKGYRCDGPKCSFSRRDYPPGMHPYRRGKVSEYSIRLREAQRCKRTYGLRDAQFRIYFRKADQQKGDAGENLLRLLERRLDNVIYRLGFGASRPEARQDVVHGHFRVNGRRVDRPSYLLRQGDVVEPDDKDRVKARVRETREQTQNREMVQWLETDEEALVGRVVNLPTVEQLPNEFNTTLIVEFFSR